MPRARSGQLVYRRSSGFNARVWVDVKDEATGEVREERRWIPLGTHDRELAKRKLAKISELATSGQLQADAVQKAKGTETVREMKEAFIVRRHRQRDEELLPKDLPGVDGTHAVDRGGSGHDRVSLRPTMSLGKPCDATCRYSGAGYQRRFGNACPAGVMRGRFARRRFGDRAEAPEGGRR